LHVINTLLQRKELFISEKNELTVKTQSGKIFPLTNLSSGEKQLLIILGQSLLQEENVHIYIADEPELSLHVEWQEKLVSSLKSLNPNSQIIFATHSPDIVGGFSRSVINVEEVVK
jgi:predicted ATPase